MNSKVTAIMNSLQEKQAEAARLSVALGESLRIQEIWKEAFKDHQRCSICGKEYFAPGTRSYKVVERWLKRSDGETRPLTETEYKYIKQDLYEPLRPGLRPYAA